MQKHANACICFASQMTALLPTLSGHPLPPDSYQSLCKLLGLNESCVIKVGKLGPKA